jgi:hypothetical protein
MATVFPVSARVPKVLAASSSVMLLAPAFSVVLPVTAKVPLSVIAP